MSVSRRELIIVCFISFLVVVASMFQLFVYLRQTPEGFIYPLVHNYVPDFYWYLSLIRQGWDGSLLMTSRYTPELLKSQFVYTFFPLMGVVARITGATSALMYTLARVFFGTALLVAGYFLASLLFVKKRELWISFLLMIFGAPFWYRDGGMIKQFGEFWTGFDPLMRVSWLPHHLAANTFLVLTLIAWIQYQKAQSFGRLAVPIFISAMLTGWLNPASGMVLVIIVAGVATFSSGIRQWHTRIIHGCVIIGVGAAIPLVMLYFVSNSVFPWTASRVWERLVFYPVDPVRFVWILGAVGVAAIFSLPIALARKSFPWTIVSLWFLVPFVGLGVFEHILPLSNGRYLQGAAHIPAALLSGLGISAVYTWLVKKCMYRQWMIPCAVFAFALLTAPSFWISIHRQLGYVEANRLNPLVYVPKSTMDAFAWLNGNAKKDAVLMAPLPVMTLLPAFTSLRVVAGHPVLTLNPSDKEQDIGAFYRFSDTQMAARILKTYLVEYVWIESIHPTPASFTSELSLRLVYSNSSVSLYKMK